VGGGGGDVLFISMAVIQKICCSKIFLNTSFKNLLNFLAIVDDNYDI
jgi:hypothetical protein